jgi:iron complex outermembrane receptor protein
LTLVCWGATAHARDGGKERSSVPDDLTSVSLEDLTRIRITSVAKKQQTVAEAPAAVYVVTSEDIRRMGATSIPEALRFVPGVQVARIDASKWAVSVRGFNGRFSNKLLALIDGRPIYSTLFSSVFWEMYDIPMDDVDRIEVVRGPGATIWGSNAVNGVINVITKPVAETLGGSASVQGGSYDGVLTTIRYGGKGAGGVYRAYAKTQQHISSPEDSLGVPDEDGWKSLRSGLRYEAATSDRDQIELQAGIHRMDGTQRTYGPLLAPPYTSFALTRDEAVTGFVLGRWRRTVSERSEIALQAYYDRLSKSEAGIYGLAVTAAEIELQHRFRPTDRLDLNWGVAYRAVLDRLDESEQLHVADRKRSYRYASVFVQAETHLIPDKLSLTTGVRLERNTLGGLALEPTASLLWTPSRRTSFWAAASQAARAPSRSEQDVRFDVSGIEVSPGLPGLISIVPSPQLDYEVATAYEGGFRTDWRDRLTADIAVFESRYRDLAQVVQLPPVFENGATPHLLIPIQLQNFGRDRRRGVELALKWRALESWDLAGTIATLTSGLSSPDAPLGSAGSSSPRDQFSLQSHWRFRRRIELSASVAHTGPIGATGFLNESLRLPGYFRTDVRLEWKRWSGTSLSIGVQDACAGRYEFHPESISVASPVRRNVYGRIGWGF